jgi:hypothetical protein
VGWVRPLTLQPRFSNNVCASYDNDIATKAEFYPTLNKSQLFPDYIAVQSGHSRGSTLDLTLVTPPSRPLHRTAPHRHAASVTLSPAGAVACAAAGGICTGAAAAALL